MSSNLKGRRRRPLGLGRVVMLSFTLGKELLAGRGGGGDLAGDVNHRGGNRPGGFCISASFC